MKKAILYLWQLPQNLLGLFLTLFSKRVGNHYVWPIGGSVSLGRYVIVSRWAGDFTFKHEQGHQKQSLYLGWLYLVVIGLPSFIWATLKTVGLFKDVSYFSFYTEKWANKLSGLE